jgi:hypothetical protein
MNEAEQEPQVALRQVSAERIEAGGDWRIEWEVENRGEQPMHISAARLPHGQFKSKEVEFDPPLNLAPHGHVRFQASVRCKEPSGLVTENAFVIFQIIWLGQRWRVFARIRVTVDRDGKPGTVSESVTTQKAGFSGIANGS